MPGWPSVSRDGRLECALIEPVDRRRLEEQGREGPVRAGAVGWRELLAIVQEDRGSDAEHRIDRDIQRRVDDQCDLTDAGRETSCGQHPPDGQGEQREQRDPAEMDRQPAGVNGGEVLNPFIRAGLGKMLCLRSAASYFSG